ncbi:4-phosphopantetheinyl transferase family protein [Micromonospora sp. C31]|uniref:4'-phosphopantetheinyl transferase family protein n=1 Tax=Micromonospora sp. C31 TaxID=2824876 RepID=UPI001B37C2D5|nr:4'-phosphopantetheinyl transferase superfamily protein [Micromonospora sp. C31]MBQ1074362.1 4-phosphopantetheinyl transferase family protein [Micromonospora sp. C31]
MSQSPVPGRDTAYVWIGRGVGGRPAPAGRLLRRAGAALLGRAEAEIVVAHGRDGRPLVAGCGAGARAELAVSVSRSGSVVVVAARAGGPVGVDVERHRPLPAAALARRWYAPVEAGWLAGRPADGQVADFLRLWTAKEAVGKALGVGLRDGGLRRRMPVPVGSDGSLRPVPGVARLRVGHPGVAGGLVVALAVDAVDAVPVEVVVVEADEVVGTGEEVGAARPGAHVAAVRSASTERTSLPVVVRGS